MVLFQTLSEYYPNTNFKNSYLERFMKGIQLPVKMCWKRIINESVRKYEKQMLETYEKDQDFIRYQQIHTSQNLYHLWKVPSTAIELKLIHFIIKKLNFSPTEYSTDVLVLWSGI